MVTALFDIRDSEIVMVIHVMNIIKVDYGFNCIDKYVIRIIN